MKTTLDEPVVKDDTATRTESNWRQDEEAAEMARKIDRSIDEAKAAISEKLQDGQFAAERLLRHGRYAVEDGLSELAHTVKRHPVSFLGIAFAAGAAVGLLLAQSSRRENAMGK